MRLGRRLILPAVLGAAVYVANLSGRLAGGLAVAGALALLAVIFILLPRLAHAAFERGDFDRAGLYYRTTRAFVANPASRGAIDVSLAGCRLARKDFAGALAALGRVEPDVLGTAARAAWFNNRAYALARGSGDCGAALTSVDEAIALRPDVAGFRHTRGVVLLALGRLDDAIAELDEVWQSVATEDAPPLLEAERCYDLGRAWQQKGEPDYARDYFQRAQAVAPRSHWAVEARAVIVTPRKEPAHASHEPT
jgi:tetratricopeptide (TPR) repeat protein